MGRGQRNILVGGLICLAGVVVTAITYGAASGGGTYVVAYGAIAGGAIQFFIGLYQRQSAPPAAATDDSLILFLHSMAFVASGDGRISDRERETIDRILEQVTGSRLPVDFSSTKLEQMAETHPEAEPAYARAARTMPSDHKNAILHCAFLVGWSDGEVERDGGKRVQRVARALGVSEQDLDALIAVIKERPARRAAESAEAQPKPA